MGVTLHQSDRMINRLHFHIDPSSGLPVYRQIMDQIKYYIASGALSSGEQLPSIRELAQTLTVNPTTIVKAYNELVHEQVIQLIHGKGAFISQNVTPLSLEEREQALRRIAKQLAVEAAQMRTPHHRILQIVEEELHAILEERVSIEMTTKLKVVSSVG